MYIPKQFEQTDQKKLHEFMEQNSFATLLSKDKDELCVSHLPVLLERYAGAQGKLIGHMARANPQRRSAEGQKVLVVFLGPHTYITPTWYQAYNVVPTWNYAAVYVYVTLRLEMNQTRLLEIVRRYVEFYEKDFAQPWSIDQADPEFVNGLLDAIVGFEIVIDRIEGKWKFNQNHEETRRRNVIQSLQKMNGVNHQQIAEMMSQSFDGLTRANHLGQRQFR